MRFIQQDNEVKKEEKSKKKEEREIAKPGEYTMEDLQGGKKRPFIGGNYNAS